MHQIVHKAGVVKKINGRKKLNKRITAMRPMMI